MKKIILDLCGGTGSWSEPYRKARYKVINITLPKYDINLWNKTKDIINAIEEGIYGILAAPPCTQFSFARTKARKPRDLIKGMKEVKSCLDIIWACQSKLKKDTQKKPPLKFWALENPNGMLKWFLGKPLFEFNPYDFGDNYKKKTCLWGYFNRPLREFKVTCRNVKFDKMKSKDIHPEYFGKLTRQERRAITPSGFAKAFFEANQ